jgi:hypothetical protein
MSASSLITITFSDFCIYIGASAVILYAYHRCVFGKKKTSDEIDKMHLEFKKTLQTPTPRRLIEEKLGYPFEKHTYTTKDGCINTVYRIPGPKGSQSEKTSAESISGASSGKVSPKPVVLYQHGLVDACMAIVCAEENSLGLRLVNAGYDLWLNNSRGNRYSRDH